MFVPESMKANTLFNKMRENKEHFAGSDRPFDYEILS